MISPSHCEYEISLCRLPLMSSVYQHRYVLQWQQCSQIYPSQAVHPVCRSDCSQLFYVKLWSQRIISASSGHHQCIISPLHPDPLHPHSLHPDPLQQGSRCNEDQDAMGIKMQRGSRCNEDQDATRIKMQRGSRCNEDQDATRIKMQRGSRFNGDKDAARIKMQQG